MTARERLEQLDQDIAAVQSGAQSYAQGSRKVTKADYSAMLAERKRLQEELAAETAPDLLSNFYVAVNPWR